MNRYFKEVLDTHVLIQDWLGDADAHAVSVTNYCYASA